MNTFFDSPIQNSPYEMPSEHWELDEDGQPTNVLVKGRRPSARITAAPKANTKRDSQGTFILDTGDNLSTESQEYNVSRHVNEIRSYVDAWRNLPNESQWQVTPETSRLLKHWRTYEFEGIRPFFCQIEAAETAIWLAEVAPKFNKQTKLIVANLKQANEDANPELFRIALKMATGAGKTTVMAMLIAWQTINAVRHPDRKYFTRGFLIITPGITIRDRLRVLQPNDPESYYEHRDLVPFDMRKEMHRAKIVITNYHAMKLREKLELSKTGRAFLTGHGSDIKSLETEGQMLQRVMPSLMSLKGVIVINDEAHHCYREKPDTDDKILLRSDDKEEAKENNEAARLWISGIEIVKRNLGVKCVYDLSATPFFLSGSGYAEGTLFRWVVSDFSLMDAIESGIVKLPRVPISDNVSREDMPIYRNLWEHIGDRMPKAGRGKNTISDPQMLPPRLQSALDILYAHYETEFDSWQKAGIAVPPVFIVVCNNTATSKLVLDYISGYEQKSDDGTTLFIPGALPLFQNFDANDKQLALPRTLLIDSVQIESGEALDPGFRKAAAPLIEQYRKDKLHRTGDRKAAQTIDDSELLREVMNTVGKEGTLGAGIRCVVSVSMLTEGWDASTVTHILGVRAFGTQLLCEQVVGRALRRLSYDLNDQGLFDAEYADIFGIPFDFTSEPSPKKPQKPKNTIRVQAMRDRTALEIRFPNVVGYRTELPNAKLTASFGPDHALRLTPEDVGPTEVTNRGIIGEEKELTNEDVRNIRDGTVLYRLATHLLMNHYRDPGNHPKIELFGQLKAICRQWMTGHLEFLGGTKSGQLLYLSIIDKATNRIAAAINETHAGDNIIKALISPYNTDGSTRFVNFTTSKELRWQTDETKCHVSHVIGDSEWELDLAEALERSPHVLAYVKNHGLGFEVPYLLGPEQKRYRPDFIVHVDDGNADGPLKLIIEVKGYRDEDAIEKANTMNAYWIPGVNSLGQFGRWSFTEFQGDAFGGKTTTQAALDALINTFRDEPVISKLGGMRI